MANTFELISSVTVGAGGAASIDFTSIPSTYTDLCIQVSARTTGTGTANNLAFSFNGSSSSRTGIYLGGQGSGTPSSSAVGEFLIWTANYSDTTSNTFSNGSIYIPNYAVSTYKSISVDSVAENNAIDGRDAFTAALWSNTAAINRVTLTPQNGTLVQYSTAYLYGVKNA